MMWKVMKAVFMFGEDSITVACSTNTLNIILKNSPVFMLISAVLQESLSHIAPPQLDC